MMEIDVRRAAMSRGGAAMSDTIEKRVETLRSVIEYHNHKYYVEANPEISDLEFDKLLVELRKIEAEHPDWITPDSPTLRAGAQPADRFEKVRHPAPILSLANAFGADDARGWYERVIRIDDRVKRAKFVVEPKIDGLSVVLHYRDGLFVQGRGAVMGRSATISRPICPSRSIRRG